MKRDMDLVREILLDVETRPWNDGKPVVLQGHADEEIAYHMMLLQQAGLLEVTDCSSEEGLAFLPISLTWQGHEFLDAARENTRWNTAKTIIKEKAGAVGFDVLKQLLAALSLRAIGL